MRRNLLDNQRGAVALITVVFMALLLTVVTTSFIRITINEQRQATDDDLTKRAFFAAESGIEDAKIALDRYLNETGYGDLQLHGDTCEKADLPGDTDPIEDTDGIQADYTCQLISVIGPSFRAKFDPWTSQSIPLEAVDSTGAPDDFTSMTLRWHEPVDDGSPFGRRGAGVTDFPDIDAWDSAGFPALIRLQFTTYPYTSGDPGSSFNRGDVDNRVVFINPSSSGVGSVFDFTNSAVDGHLISGTCSDTASVSPGGYACEVTFDGFADASRNTHVRISALYAQANVEVVLDGGDADMANASAIIDVTGQAGDVYRRVQVVVGLTGRDLLPDAAVTSADDVCKDFFVTDLDTEFNAINPTIDAYGTRLCR